MGGSSKIRHPALLRVEQTVKLGQQAGAEAREEGNYVDILRFGTKGSMLQQWEVESAGKITHFGRFDEI